MSELADILASARRAVFFGGAGVSTESGIPDFRSASGLYATEHALGHPPEYLLSHSCLERDPAAFFDFHRTKLVHRDARPNRAHRALAEWERRGGLAAVITQNIDGLHQAAGSRTVLELHGSTHRNSCVECGRSYDLDFLLAAPGAPACPECGAMVRPDVVLYEEALDGAVIEASLAAIEAADVLVVGGTSLNVHPAAGMIRFYVGEALVLVNLKPTPYDHVADLVIHEPIGQVLGEALGVE